MKLLLLHVNWIEWEPTKKALKQMGDIEKKKHRVEEALVVLTAVEKSDEKNPQEAALKLVREIKDVARQLKAEKIVLYPYAHLSKNLGSPSSSLLVFDKAEKILKKDFFVERAEFGWYKKLALSAKGHPLSELSREIVLGDTEKAQKIPSKVKKPAKEQKITLDRRNLPENDHRILGQNLQIFHISDEIGSGLPLWMPNGAKLRQLLIDYMQKIEEKYGYKYVSTPHIAKGSIYESTGHLPYYKDSMYAPIEIDGVDYYLKPMNCPHHHMIFKQLVQSYRDLPLRLAEPGMTYRNELSGVLYGLIRAKGFTQNDAHIYVKPDQLKAEFLKVLDMFKEVYKVMEIKGYWFRLSLPDFKKNPDKFTGDPKEWEYASKEIRKAMKEFGHKFVEEKGEAAFYGPKIDVQIKNTLGKEETIATSQVDIVVPKRLGLTYKGKDDSNKNDLIVIHRAILGSYERFIAYLLEQTKGKFPVWLSPVQVRVLTFTDRNIKSVEKFVTKLKEHEIRTEADTRHHTVEYKVRESEMQKVPYTIVIGDKEEKNNTLAVRSRGAKKAIFGVKKDNFLKQILKEIKEKK